MAVELYDKPSTIEDVEEAFGNSLDLTQLNDFNEMANVRIRRFADSRPEPGTEYFSTPQRPGGLAVIIPFFNEPMNELQTTLESLHDAFRFLTQTSNKWANQTMRVLIIQDGWYKADDSMQDYLKQLFPGYVKDQPWWEAYNDFVEQPDRADGPITFTFETENDRPIVINPGAMDEKLINLSLIVKIDNRRKHNSHEWFLGKSGFAETTQAEYLMCTDAFTIFHEACVYHLVDYMDRNPTSSAATGRQRVMDREMQGTYESTLSLGYMLRMVQLFDFELANAVYNGAFSLGGFLPVIPGPCGLYRAADVLQDNVRDWYFDVVNEEPDQTGMVLGNLRIAEDRVLSYSTVLKTEEVRHMGFVTLAMFYFEAELDLQRFVLQRRRWINGSVAGYIYLLFLDPKHFWGWNASFARKLYVWTLLMCQLIIYGAVAIAPAFSLRLLNYSTNYILQLAGMESTDSVVLTTVAMVIYLGHVSIHSSKKFNHFIFYTLLVISFLTTTLSTFSLLWFGFVENSEAVWNIVFGTNPVVWLALIVLLVPFALGLVISARGHSFWYMLKAIGPYSLFSHMIISWFGAYSFARTHDLSWGNRPADQLADLGDEKKRQALQDEFKLKAANLTIILVILNIIIFYLPRDWQLAVLSVFFASAAFQMVFSVIYLFKKIPDKFRFLYKYLTKREDHPDPYRINVSDLHLPSPGTLNVADLDQAVDNSDLEVPPTPSIALPTPPAIPAETFAVMDTPGASGATTVTDFTTLPSLGTNNMRLPPISRQTSDVTERLEGLTRAESQTSLAPPLAGTSSSQQSRPEGEEADVNRPNYWGYRPDTSASDESLPNESLPEIPSVYETATSTPMGHQAAQHQTGQLEVTLVRTDHIPSLVKQQPRCHVEFQVGPSTQKTSVRFIDRKWKKWNESFKFRVRNLTAQQLTIRLKNSQSDKLIDQRKIPINVLRGSQTKELKLKHATLKVKTKFNKKQLKGGRRRNGGVPGFMGGKPRASRRSTM